MIKPWIAASGAVLFNAVASLSAQAYDITERVWAGGVIAGVYQYQFLADDDGTDEGGGNDYTFWGVQLSYTMETPLGEATYRFLVDGTTDECLDEADADKESLGAVILSFDQQLGDIFGAFLRFGWQKDDAAVDVQTLYSGGLNISGKLWQRPQDNIGIGYAYVDGGNLDIERIHVVEAYARFALNDYVAVTADLQYIDEPYTDGSGPAGWMPGLRVTAEF